jgi:hypothetical protein
LLIESQYLDGSEPTPELVVVLAAAGAAHQANRLANVFIATNAAQVFSFPVADLAIHVRPPCDN